MPRGVINHGPLLGWAKQMGHTISYGTNPQLLMQSIEREDPVLREDNHDTPNIRLRHSTLTDAYTKQVQLAQKPTNSNSSNNNNNFKP